MTVAAATRLTVHWKRIITNKHNLILIQTRPDQLTQPPVPPPFISQAIKGYNDERFVVENVAVGFTQSFLCTLLTGESHKGLAFHAPLLH